MVTDLGAANHYKLEHLKSPEIWAYVEEAKVFYVGGFHLTVCVPAILALGEHAAKTNKVGSYPQRKLSDRASYVNRWI